MKKVLYIVGCAAPGKDGIGDYSRTLALELAKQGVHAQLLALWDRHCREVVVEVQQGIQCLRIPARSSWKQRKAEVDTWITHFNPDLISLEFVIYSFHPKGLPVLTLPRLSGLINQRAPLQIMFHEPWIGRSSQDKLAHRLIGIVQRMLIVRMYHQMKPSRAYTSNYAFRSLLRKNGIEAEVLPLPSNISFTPNGLTLVESWMHMNQLPIHKDELRLGLFGRIPHSWRWRELLDNLDTLCDHAGKTSARIFLAGRSDRVQADEFRRLVEEYKPDLEVISFGEQGADMISGFLQFIHIGLAATPRQIIGKSGAVAAYREHGKPVLMVGPEESYSNLAGEPNPKRYFSLDNIPQELATWISTPAREDTRHTVANQIIQSFEPQGARS